MGWWNARRDGASLQLEETGLLWGDGPANVIDNAVDEIREQFRIEAGREPLVGELRAGLEFSLMGRADDAPADDLDRAWKKEVGDGEGDAEPG